MGVIALLLAAAFPGNGYHCFGSPAGTGDLLPGRGDRFVTGIAVLLQGREQRPVGWLYTSDAGQYFVQRGAGEPVMPYRPGTLDRDIRQLRCSFPMPVVPLP